MIDSDVELKLSVIEAAGGNNGALAAPVAVAATMLTLALKKGYNIIH